MKKTFILLALFFIGFLHTVNAQQQGLKNIVGLWTSESTSTRLVFFFDKNDKLQLVEWDSRGGEEMEILNIETNADTVKTAERFASTKYSTYNAYFLTSEDTMGNTITGENVSTIYFKRKK